MQQVKMILKVLVWFFGIVCVGVMFLAIGFDIMDQISYWRSKRDEDDIFDYNFFNDHGYGFDEGCDEDMFEEE